jgi:hypothetical protein
LNETADVADGRARFISAPARAGLPNACINAVAES